MGAAWLWSELGYWGWFRPAVGSIGGVLDAPVPDDIGRPPTSPPAEWLATHEDWEPVWVPNYTVNSLVSGTWAWHPPAPEPLNDNGHWEWHWYGDSKLSYTTHDDVPAEFQSIPLYAYGGYFDWLWVEDQP